MPCLGEGRGHRVRQRQKERGGRNGLQDKPTFLKTPRVVITGSKQLKPPHWGWHGFTIITLQEKKKKKDTPWGYLSDEIRACDANNGRTMGWVKRPWSLRITERAASINWIAFMLWGYLSGIEKSTHFETRRQFASEVDTKSTKSALSVTVCHIYACYSNSPAIYCLGPGRCLWLTHPCALLPQVLIGS